MLMNYPIRSMIFLRPFPTHSPLFLGVYMNDSMTLPNFQEVFLTLLQGCEILVTKGGTAKVPKSRTDIRDKIFLGEE